MLKGPPRWRRGLRMKPWSAVSEHWLASSLQWMYTQPAVDLRQMPVQGEELAAKDQRSLWCFRLCVFFIGSLCLLKYL